MNEKALKTLEFHKIIKALSGRATSPLGRMKCEKLLPLSDLSEIRAMQKQTADAVGRILRNGTPSFGNARPIGASLKRLEVGSALAAGELLSIAGLLENCARAKAFGRHDNADTEEDSLDPIFDLLNPLTPLSTEIRRCILSEDEIADDASSTLRQIRRQISQNGDKIHSQLQSMINGPLRNALQDAVITMRDGRYCVPVKAENRSAVPGMIHDQSSTGATLFIEPMAIIKLNNESIPNANATLRVGDEITIFSPEPELSVVGTERRYYEENYDAEVEYIDVDDWYTNQTEVVQQPVTGYRKVVADITYRNAELVNTDILYEDVTVKAVAKIVKRGTKTPPTYVYPVWGRLYSEDGRLLR